MMWWYSSEANNVLNTTIQVSWDYKKETYNCTPMMKDDHYGNTFNFDTCMELARPPKISNPAAATDSVIWVEAKQAWKYVPYAHLPKKAAAYTDKTFSFEGGYVDSTAAAAAETKFKADLANLNTCKAESYGRVQGSMEDAGGKTPTKLGSSKSTRAARGSITRRPDVFPRVRLLPHARVRVQKLRRRFPRFVVQGRQLCTSNHWNPQWWLQRRLQRPLPSLEPMVLNVYGEREVSFKDGMKNGMYLQQWREIVHEDFCMYGKIDGLLDKLTKLAGVKNWTKVLAGTEELSMSTEQTLMGYSRSKTLELCELTEAEALAMFKLYYDSTFVCQYAKSSAPFGCESSTPLPISQCFSLAYANSLLLYTVFSAICVKIFFAAKKDEPDESAAKGTVNNERMFQENKV